VGRVVVDADVPTRCEARGVLSMMCVVTGEQPTEVTPPPSAFFVAESAIARR
jgi:hypothetical protein